MMFNPFLTIDLRPCGDDFVAHRQGHRVREEISMQVAFGAIHLGIGDERPTTDMRVEIFDLPAHLIRPDGTIQTGSRHILALCEQLDAALPIEVSDEIGFPGMDDRFQPVPGRPGHFAFATCIAGDIAASLSELPMPQIETMLDDPRITFDAAAITRL